MAQTNMAQTLRTPGLRDPAPAAARLMAGEAEINGAHLVLDATGALWWPQERALLVADLHLETGAAFARRGSLVPPYDSAATLDALEDAFTRLDAPRVICLGDSFHDRHGARRIAPDTAARLASLMRDRDWLWIAGNHDDESAGLLGGGVAEELALGPLVLRHHPTPGDAPGEVAGHLHPAARVALGHRAVKVKCLAYDAARAVLPAFGALTGGLNVRARPFHDLFDGPPHVLGLSGGKVMAIPRTRLV